MTAKKKTTKKPQKQPKEYIQIGPSLFMDDAGDPAPPPYKRYVVWTPKRKKKTAK